MSKTRNLHLRVGDNYSRTDMSEIIRAITQQLDGITEGGIAYKDNARSATPAASVAAATGDFVPNRNPTVMGSTSSQYVVFGWLCTASGTPGTWVELQALTGT